MKEYKSYVNNYKVSGSELYHFGIPGQKWGVRRYENEDGTLTEEGKKRYSKYSQDAITKERNLRKNKNELSTKELNELNNRLQAEQNYDRLTKSKSATFADNLIKNTIGKTGNLVVGMATGYVAKQVFDTYVKPNLNTSLEDIAWMFVKK